MRNTETVRSIASCLVVAAGESSAAMASSVAWPTVRSPVLDMIYVSDWTRSGCSIATVCAIIPPIDAPTTCAPSSPSASSRPTVSPAMSDSVYEAEEISPANADTTAGAGAAWRCVESLMSRLSNRMTWRRRATSASQKPVRPTNHLRCEPHHQHDGRCRRIAEPLVGDVDPAGPTPRATSTLTARYSLARIGGHCFA
jgi:hypothetical protein